MGICREVRKNYRAQAGIDCEARNERLDSLVTQLEASN